MSEDISNIRRYTNTRSQVRNLIKEFNLSRNLSVPNENLDKLRQQVDLDGVIEVTDDFTTFTGKKPKEKGYFLTFEPDLEKLQLWHKLNAPFSLSIDSSFHLRNGIMNGIPLPIRGYDNGLIGSVQIATGLDGVDDWIDIPHDPTIEFYKVKDGFSFHIKFAPCAIDLSNGHPVTLYAKKDPADPFGRENSIISVVMPDGSVNTKLRFKNHEYTASAPNFFPADQEIGIDKWYDHTVRFSPISERLDLLLDNVIYNQPWQNPHLTPYPVHDISWHIGRSTFTNRGLYWGGLGDFRFYWDLFLTNQHNYNLFTNRITISNIPYGHAAVIGHSYITHSVDVGVTGGFKLPLLNGKGFIVSPHLLFESEPVSNDLIATYKIRTFPKVEHDLEVIYNIDYNAPVTNNLEIVYDIEGGDGDGTVTNDLLLSYDILTLGNTPPPIQPPIVCPPLFKYNPNTGTCVPKETSITCPTGKHYDEVLQLCVCNPVNPPPTPQDPPVTPPTQGGQVDSNGIYWHNATGTGGVISQSRNEAADDRWSENITGIRQYGFEQILYGTFSGTNSSSHCASKLWGSNHSGSGASEHRWYDLGIRVNGDIQLQWEGPHPSNHDFTLNSSQQFIDNIGIGMEGKTIGIKWQVFPVIPNGTALNGGVHLRMWVDTSGFNSAGKPQNNWRLAIDFIDTGFVIQPSSYAPDDDMELEVRNSDTNSQTFYAGGVHYRRFKASDSTNLGGTTTTTQNQQLTTQATAVANITYSFNRKWGSNGTGNGQFRQMEGIAVDGDGNIYVSDWVRHDIQKFSPTGTFIRRYGGTVGVASSANGQFNTPFGMAFDPQDGHMWVCDQFNHRIQKINKDTGAYITQIGPTISGLTSPTTLNEPEDVAFDPVDFSMYINDQHNSRIIKVNSSGTFVTKWKPFPLSYPDEYPEGMTVHPKTRNVYLTAYFSPEVWVYSPTGQFLDKITLPEGTGTNQFTLPMERHAFDKDGNLYQINGNPNPKVYVFDTNSKNVITSFGSGPSSADGGLSDAEWCAVDKNYDCYVTDQNNYRVSVFSRTTTPVTNPPPTQNQPAMKRFILWGDNDTTTDAENVLTAIMQENGGGTDPIPWYLFLGDGPYSTSALAWIAMMDSYFDTDLKKNWLILTQGNHDHSESESQTTEDQIEAWRPSLANADDNLDWLSARKIGNTYVISMNTQDPQIRTVGGDQHTYVQNKLNEAKALRASGAIDWIIVIAHKPMFCMLSSNQPEILWRNEYTSMFSDAQVDFVFSGHNHNMHIWKPVVPIVGNNGNTAANPLFQLASDGRYNMAVNHGPMFAVFGNGGHEHNSFGIAATSNVLFRNDTDFGYGVLEVQGKQAKLIAKNVNGVVLYNTELTRGVDNTTNPPTTPTPCVDTNPPPLGQCPQGYHRDPVTQQCVPDTGTPPTTCPQGYHKDPITQQCVPDTVTPPPATQPVMLMGFVGDTDGSTPQQIYASMKNKGVTKFGHIGDVVYGSSASTQLGNITSGLGFTKENMVCSIGNHDHPNEDGSQAVLDAVASYFNLPSSTYCQSRQWLNVYVIAMNSQDSNFSSTTSAQYTFVKTELEKATALKTQGSVNWIIVLIHKPFYIGSGNDHPADEEGGRSIYQALFDQHNVDFVFHGHNHNIDTFKPLKSGGTLLATVSNNVYDFTKPHGQFYMTIGSGGRSRDSVSSTTNSQFVTGGSFGYCLLTLNNTGLIMQVQILSPTGSTLHEFQVSKQGVPPATGGGGGTDPPPTGGGGGGGTPPPVTGETLVWDSGIWANGQQRTITCHQCFDPFDDRVQVAAGSNRKWFIDGQGSSFLSGDQSRLYFEHNTYNHRWEARYTPKSGLDNFSLRSRSRHNNGGAESNRFGGYGVAFHQSTGELEFAREDYHNVHTDMSPNTITVASSPNNTEIGINIWMYDNTSNKPTLKVAIDRGSGYVTAGTSIDPSPEAYMLDKALYNDNSFIWIRTNGSNPVDNRIRNMKIFKLPDNYNGT